MPDFNAAVPQGVFGQEAVRKILSAPPVILLASGAIDPSLANRYLISKTGSLAALTIAAPRAGTDDFMELQFISTTAFQHTLVSTGNFVDGAGHVNQATWSANAGGSLLLIAYQGKWYVQALQSVTMS